MTDKFAFFLTDDETSTIFELAQTILMFNYNLIHDTTLTMAWSHLYTESSNDLIFTALFAYHAFDFIQ